MYVYTTTPTQARPMTHDLMRNSLELLGYRVCHHRLSYDGNIITATLRR